MMVSKVETVKMVLLEYLEMMVPLETQDLKDHLVIKVVMQLSGIVVDAHHPVPSKAPQVAAVNQAILAHPVGLAVQVLVVNLVDAFLVIVEHLERMVNQVMMESMVNLVNQVNLEALEITWIFKTLVVQISLLT